MATASIGIKEILGRKIEVFCNDNGTFHATFNQEVIKAPSLKGLQEKLRVAVKSAGAIELPLTKIEVDDNTFDNERHFTAEQVTVIGLSGRRRDAVYRDADGNEDSVSYYHSEVWFRRLTDQELAEVEALHLAVITSQRAWDAWVEAHHVNVTTAVEEAQAQVAAQPDEEPQP